MYVALGFTVHDVKAPTKIKFDAKICDSGSTQWVGVFGEFGARRLSSKKPVVKLVVDKENIPVKWTFNLGGANGDSDTHSFTLGTQIDFFYNNSYEHPLLLGMLLIQI